MNKFLKILLIILVILVIGGLVFSLYIGYQVYDQSTNSYPREDTLNNISYFKEELDYLKSNYDVEILTIPATENDGEIPILHGKNGNNRLAVLVHGMGGTKETTSNLGRIFLELDFDILSLDQRNSGENPGRNTFGFKESLDILDVINYGKDLGYEEILLFGESYGALAAVIAASRDESNIDYLVLDSPMHDGEEFLDEILLEVEKEQGVPVGYMKFFATPFFAAFQGANFEDFDGRIWIKDIKAPLLIFGSEADNVTQLEWVKQLYNSKTKDNKELVISKTAGHIEIPVKEEELFKEKILEFIDKY